MERKESAHQRHGSILPKGRSALLRGAVLQYFDELAEEGEVPISQPRGIPLLAWEDLEGNKNKANFTVQKSSQHPRPSKKQKKDKAKR